VLGQDPNSGDLDVLEGSREDKDVSVEAVAEMQTSITELLDETEGTVATATREAVPAAGGLAIGAPTAIVPTIVRRAVSGRYIGTIGTTTLELRVDVDGRRPLRRVSGDFFRTTGATTTYVGSFVMDTPTIAVSTTLVTIQGRLRTTYATSFPVLRVRIPRVGIWMPQGAADAQFMSLSGQPGALYRCTYRSPYFRSVDLEQDCLQGVTPFPAYNTGSLPSGGPARTLSVPKAYAEAGIEMRVAGIPNVIPTGAAGADSKWDNNELHAAMVKHFSLWKDVPQWKVWLFHTRKHVFGPGLLGIMFDQMGRQRQGCAVFYDAIAGNTADKLRNQLYTCVHELGHCFNLYHSFHKKFMTPPLANRLDALSWMNYPQRYPNGGTPGFWSAFPFQFDDLEVVHLRHAFRNNIIIGGNPFGTGAALETGASSETIVADESGLKLELRARPVFALGEPVTVEVKLCTTDGRGKRVNSFLHPREGFVRIAIRKPGGQVVPFEPLIDHCVADDTLQLDTGTPAIYAGVYVGYGKGGFTFDQSGSYQLQATYFALDGSIVQSDVLRLRVRSPLTATDEAVADLLMGEDVGTILALKGSEAPELAAGNAALEKLIDAYGKHPLAEYARFVKGLCLVREFKTIGDDGVIAVRKPQVEEGAALLGSVVQAAAQGRAFDNVTLSETMLQLAACQKQAGAEDLASNTIGTMLQIFKDKQVPQPVMSKLEVEALEIAGIDPGALKQKTRRS